MSVEPVVERLTAFGFDTVGIDAHDHAALTEALHAAGSGGASDGAASNRPRAIVLQTTPGKGVPEFERHHRVHYLRLEPEAWADAIAALR